ncbi:MAG: hypothetical protein QOG34_1131 [Frankiaceae bacterium]|nr:hypothetical protein [Frankiaceae bacterium]
MNRITIAAAAAVAASAIGVVVTISAGAPPHPTALPHVPVRLAADSATGVVSYDSEGVTVAPPLASTSVPAPAAATAQTVMDSFRTQQVPAGVVGKQMDSASHTVGQAQVTESMPVSPEVVAGVPYAAWVVTYTGLPAVSYAPAPPPPGLSCTFVGVMNRATGDWTEFFSSCS